MSNVTHLQSKLSFLVAIFMFCQQTEILQYRLRLVLCFSTFPDSQTCFPAVSNYAVEATIYTLRYSQRM